MLQPQSLTFAATEDTPLSVGATAGLLSKFTGAGLKVSTPGTQATAKGTVTVREDGSFDYTPRLNTNGQDTFTVTARANDCGATDALVTVTINIGACALHARARCCLVGNARSNAPRTSRAAPRAFTRLASPPPCWQISTNTPTAPPPAAAVNDAPVASVITFFAYEDTQLVTTSADARNLGLVQVVSVNDVDGDDVTAVPETKATAQDGNVTIFADGHIIYNPPKDFNSDGSRGFDSFPYSITDGTVTVTSTAQIQVGELLRVEGQASAACGSVLPPGSPCVTTACAHAAAAPPTPPLCRRRQRRALCHGHPHVRADRGRGRDLPRAPPAQLCERHRQPAGSGGRARKRAAHRQGQQGDLHKGGRTHLDPGGAQLQRQRLIHVPSHRRQRDHHCDRASCSQCVGARALHTRFA